MPLLVSLLLTMQVLDPEAIVAKTIENARESHSVRHEYSYYTYLSARVSTLAQEHQEQRKYWVLADDGPRQLESSGAGCTVHGRPLGQPVPHACQALLPAAAFAHWLSDQIADARKWREPGLFGLLPLQTSHLESFRLTFGGEFEYGGRPTYIVHFEPRAKPARNMPMALAGRIWIDVEELQFAAVMTDRLTSFKAGPFG